MKRFPTGADWGGVVMPHAVVGGKARAYRSDALLPIGGIDGIRLAPLPDRVCGGSQCGVGVTGEGQVDHEHPATAGLMMFDGFAPQGLSSYAEGLAERTPGVAICAIPRMAVHGCVPSTFSRALVSSTRIGSITGA